MHVVIHGRIPKKSVVLAIIIEKYSIPVNPRPHGTLAPMRTWIYRNIIFFIVNLLTGLFPAWYLVYDLITNSNFSTYFLGMRPLFSAFICKSLFYHFLHKLVMKHRILYGIYCSFLHPQSL